MSTLIFPCSAPSGARVIHNRNPRAPTIEPLAPYYRLRAPDGRYLNIDGSGFTDGDYPYIGNLRQAKAMRRIGALAAGCKLVAVNPNDLKFAATDATHGHVGAPVSVRRSNS